MSEDDLNDCVLIGPCVAPSTFPETLDQAEEKERESAEASDAVALERLEEKARHDSDDEAACEEEAQRDGGVRFDSEVQMNPLTEMLIELSKRSAHNVIHGISNANPPAYSDDAEDGEAIEKASPASMTLQAERSGLSNSDCSAATSPTSDNVFRERPSTAKGDGAKIDRETQAVPAGTVPSQLVDRCAVPPVTSISPANASNAKSTDDIGIMNRGSVSGKFDHVVLADVAAASEPNKRVRFVPGEGTLHDAGTCELSTAGATDNTSLKRPFNQQNIAALRFTNSCAGYAEVEAESEPELLGGKAAPFADSEPQSPSSQSSTIAKLSGVIASKARGETHPTEPHKSPKRFRYDAHGRGAYIPGSDDDVDLVTSADEEGEGDTEDARRNEFERPAHGALGAFVNLAAISKETIIKSLEILIPGRRPLVDSMTGTSQPLEVDSTPQSTCVTGTIATMPLNLACGPSVTGTGAVSNSHGDHVGVEGLPNVVNDSVNSLVEDVEAKAHATAAVKALPQDVQASGEAAGNSTMDTNPSVSPSLRQRWNTNAQPKTSISGVEASWRANTDVGGLGFKSWTVCALIAAASILLVYLIVPLVVRDVTAA